jgi:hypothetical protein
MPLFAILLIIAGVYIAILVTVELLIRKECKL